MDPQSPPLDLGRTRGVRQRILMPSRGHPCAEYRHTASIAATTLSRAVAAVVWVQPLRQLQPTPRTASTAHASGTSHGARL